MSKFSPIIADHFTNPRHAGQLTNPTHHIHQGNSTCGDQIDLMITAEGTHISEVAFEARGCVAALAVGSFLAEKTHNNDYEQFSTMSLEEFCKLVVGLRPEHVHAAQLGLDTVLELMNTLSTSEVCNP